MNKRILLKAGLVVCGLCIIASAALTPTPAEARVVVGIGLPLGFPFVPYPYPYPYYYPAYVPPPVYAPPPTPVAPQAQTWYYCDNPNGYYPYVTSCSTGWRQVPAHP